MVLCIHATKKLNCWNTVKLLELQRKDEISLNVIRSENRKNLVDGTRLNPKSYFRIGNQQVSSEQEKLQRLFLLREVHSKLLAMEVVSPKL